MEQDTGRRRSSRLAARGVTTPKSEVVKKTIKSSEKPKRAKRKINEDIEKLTDAKKTKIEEKTSPEAEKCKNNDFVLKNVSVVIQMDEKNNMKANMMALAEHNKTTVEKKPEIISTEPRKQTVDVVVKEEIDEPIETTDETDENQTETTEETDENQTETIEETDENQTETTEETDENQTETTKEPTAIKEPENHDQKKSDISQDETKQECLENINGKNDDKETVEEEIIISVNELSVNKDTVTPNGNTNDQEKPDKDDKSIAETEPIEPTVLQDDTNHVETDVKAVSIPTIAITASNDVSSIEQVEKGLDKVVNNVVDNMSVTVENNTPNVS